MYRSRLIGPEERAAYNKFIAAAEKGHILQAYEWGEIKGKGEWQPLRLLIEDNSGMPQAALSVLQRSIPGSGKTIFYAPRGPVGDINNWELMDFLFAEARKLAIRQKAIMLKIDPDVPLKENRFASYLHSRGFRRVDSGQGFEGVQPRFVFRLDINASEEELFNNFHPKTRYNIRLAQKKGVVIREDLTRDVLPVFYDLLKETTERDRFLVRPYQYFEDLWDVLVPQGQLKLFMAYYQGEAIAGTLAFILGDKAWYIYGASSNRSRNVMPNYLLQWTMIRWAKANNCKMYDFRGVPGHLTEENPLYGLYRFKKGFNGEFTEFIGEYDLVFAPFWYWAWRFLLPVYQKNVRRIIGIKKKLVKAKK